MRNEADVPADERRLIIEAIVSTKMLLRVRAGLPLVWPKNSRCVFVSYAYADLPLGKQLDFVFPLHRPDELEPTIATIFAATQQFGEPFDSIPHGWKTICIIDFPVAVPKLIVQLGVADAWGVATAPVVLCDAASAPAPLTRT